MGVDNSGHERVDGSLLFADLSGFTALTERLTSRGRLGVEQLTGHISEVFTALLTGPWAATGRFLCFGGDALLLAFEGDDHADRAVAAALEMRETNRRVGRRELEATSIRLRMSIGIHSGPIDVVRALGREVVAADAADAVLAAEGRAGAGQICVGTHLLQSRARPPRARPQEQSRSESTMPQQNVPTAGQADGHRVVSVAFLHIGGFDGASGSVAELGPAIERAATTLVDHGVTVIAIDVALDGVKVLACAGAPVSRADDEERLLLATRAVMDLELPFAVRAGVDVGAVFATTVDLVGVPVYTLMGDAVNTAARLVARAEPRQVLASLRVLARSATQFAEVPVPSFAAKGKAELVAAAVAGKPLGRRITPGVDLPLVGRDDELRRLVAAVDAARRNAQGAVLEIVGESGIGKSRLARELVGVASSSSMVIQCDPYRSGTPYGAIRQMLGTQVDRIERAVGDGVADDVRRERVAAALAEALSALVPPERILVVEDVQWIDPSSRAVLANLAAGPNWFAGIVVMTGSDETPPITSDALALDRLGPTGARHLARLARASGGIRPDEADRIAARSGGLPLLVVDLVQGGHDLPETVEAAVASQLDRLPRPERRLLALASALGHAVDGDLLRALADDEGLVVDPARLVPFLRQSPSGLVFAAGVYRDVAHAGLAFADRIRIHSRVVDLLEAGVAGAADDTLEARSLHAYEARRWEMAWSLANTAAERIFRRAPNEAVAAAARAVNVSFRLAALGPAGRGAALLVLARCLVFADRFDEALVVARRGWRLTSEPVDRAELAAILAECHRFGGRNVLSVQWARRCLRVLPSDLDDVRGARLRTTARAAELLANVMMGRAPNEVAIAELERSARLAADDAGLARALAIAQLVTNSAGGTEYTKGQEAVALYRRLGNRVAEGMVLNNCASAALRAGALLAAAEFLSSAVEVLDEAGELVSAAVARANGASVDRQRGEVARTIEPLEVALATCRATGMVREAASAAASLALALAMTGGSGERIDELVAEVDLASFGSTFAGDEILLDLAAVALHRGCPSDAAALLDGRPVDFEATTRVAGNLKAWATAAMGNETAAIEQLRKQLASTPLLEPLARMFDEHTLSVLLARCGQPDEPHRSHAEALAHELGVVRFVDPPLDPT